VRVMDKGCQRIEDKGMGKDVSHPRMKGMHQREGEHIDLERGHVNASGECVEGGQTRRRGVCRRGHIKGEHVKKHVTITVTAANKILQ
jgi:hypothetical protein